MPWDEMWIIVVRLGSMLGDAVCKLRKILMSKLHLPKDI